MPPELVALVEGLALRTPALSMATITRRAAQAAAEHGWAAPSYSTVRAVATALDPAIVALAHDGPAAFRDRFELVYRRRATHPNDVWQADHTQLDIIVLDSDGQPVRPWLTVILAGCRTTSGICHAGTGGSGATPCGWQAAGRCRWTAMGGPKACRGSGTRRSPMPTLTRLWPMARLTC